jgi:transposase
MEPMGRRSRYPQELRERAVRIVHEHRDEYPSEWAAITSIAGKLGVGTEALRVWLRRARVDEGQRPGLTSEERERLKQLERENRELRRANEILKAASAFFAYMFTMIPPCGLARFFAAQVRLWLFLDAPPTRHLGPLGVI